MHNAGMKPESRNLWTIHTVGLSVVCLAMIFVRLYDLRAYPLVQADEGLWTFSAKNFVVLGDWFLGGRTHLFKSPMFHFLEVPVFLVAGHGIVQARFISAVFGIFSLTGLYLLARSLSFSKRSAVLATVLLGFNSFYVNFNRSALVESVQVCFVIWSFYFLSRKGIRNIILAGVVFAMACLTKVNVLYFLAPLYGMLIVGSNPKGREPEKRSFFKARFLYLLLPFLLLLAAVHGALYALHPDEYYRSYQFELDGNHFSQGDDGRIGRFGIKPSLIADSAISLFADMPFLMVFSILGCLEVFLNRRREYVFLVVWLATGTLFNMSQIYQPIRYYVPLVPAMCLLAVTVLDKRWSNDVFQLRFRRFQWDINHAVLVVFAIVVFNMARSALSYAGAKDDTPFLVTQWFNKNVSAEAVAVGPDYLLTSLKQKALPFYGFPNYVVDKRTAEDNGIEYIVFDDHEWADYCKSRNNGFASYLEDHYALVNRINYVSIFRVHSDE